MQLLSPCADRTAAGSTQTCREGLQGTYIFIPVLRAPLLRRSPPRTYRGNERQTSQAYSKALPRAREAPGGGLGKQLRGLYLPTRNQSRRSQPQA